MSICRNLSTTSFLKAKCCCSRRVCRLPISTAAFRPPSSHHERFSFNELQSSFRGSRRGDYVVSRASEEPFDVNKVLNDALKDLQEAWDKTEDKLALGSLGFSAFLVLWASTGVVGAIDRLPLLPSFFELIGVFYSTWFAYRYLLFKPDREELRKKADAILNSIIGSKEMQ